MNKSRVLFSASADNSGFDPLDTVCRLHHRSLHGIPASSGFKTLPKHVAKYL
jgi:hypothetical protein